MTAAMHLFPGAVKNQTSAPREMSAESAATINDAQLIMAEKRDSLAAMRSAIAAFALPLSLPGLPIATSRHCDAMQVVPLIGFISSVLSALVVPGGYRIIRALRIIHPLDRLITPLKSCHSKEAWFFVQAANVADSPDRTRPERNKRMNLKGIQSWMITR